MGLILNIETSSTNCSVSLSNGGETLVLKEDNNKGYSHAEKLHLFIADVFKSASVDPQQIDAIAVSKGPGSYTGLRIGVSAAKGLCFALNKPLISVSTLEALARQVSFKNGLIIPMLDARRMEAYTAIFNSDYSLKRDIEAEIITASSFEDQLDIMSVYFIGTAVTKTQTIIKHPNAVFIEDHLPSACTMGIISELKYQKSDTEDVAYFEPFYLKEFVGIKSKS